MSNEVRDQHTSCKKTNGILAANQVETRNPLEHSKDHRHLMKPSEYKRDPKEPVWEGLYRDQVDSGIGDNCDNYHDCLRAKGAFNKQGATPDSFLRHAGQDAPGTQRYSIGRSAPARPRTGVRTFERHDHNPLHL